MNIRDQVAVLLARGVEFIVVGGQGSGPECVPIIARGAPLDWR